jgi:hypothetical protein
MMNAYHASDSDSKRYDRPGRRLARHGALLPVLSVILAWTGQLQALETLDFSINPEALEAVGLAGRSSALEQQISNNLHSEGYAIAPGVHTHTGIEVLLGPVEKKSTPVGLSFSFGNSDPRAIDYQQAQVIRITCRWHEAGSPVSQITQEVAVSAKSEPHVGTITEKEAIDNIGAVCLNLLAARQVPASAPSQGSRWVPPLRVEVRDKDTDKVLSPLPQPIPATGPATTAVTTPSNQDPTTSANEVTPAQEGRKKLVIHNLGSPVELEFGYQRR